jgi:hypothetical protein
MVARSPAFLAPPVSCPSFSLRAYPTAEGATCRDFEDGSDGSRFRRPPAGCPRDASVGVLGNQDMGGAVVVLTTRPSLRCSRNVTTSTRRTGSSRRSWRARARALGACRNHPARHRPRRALEAGRLASAVADETPDRQAERTDPLASNRRQCPRVPARSQADVPVSYPRRVVCSLNGNGH